MELDNTYDKLTAKDIHDTYDVMNNLEDIISKFNTIIKNPLPFEFQIYGDSHELMSIRGVDSCVVLQALNDARDAFINAYNTNAMKLNYLLK